MALKVAALLERRDDLALEPSISRAERTVVRIVTSIGPNIGELWQSPVGDVLREAFARAWNIEGHTVRLVHIREVSQYVMADVVFVGGVRDAARAGHR